MGQPTPRPVTTPAELLEAAGGPAPATLEVRGVLADLPSFRLGRGVRLTAAAGAALRFAAGQDGVRLTADNSLDGLEIGCDPDRTAIGFDPEGAGFGEARLERLRVRGCIRLVAEGAVTGGHLVVDDVHVLAADAREGGAGPRGFGVDVVPGAFTLWNRQPSGAHRITAEIRGLAAGLREAPVRGTAILVGGAPGGGETIVSLLESGAVWSDGGIPAGTADRISGGVFVVQGACVEEVRNAGPVTTYGANDMVLDNWGRVERWRALDAITSHGPNGIGFVNLGQLGTLAIEGVLETHGPGACGFNSGEVGADPASLAEAAKSGAYAGAVREAGFARIVTRGDGAVGVQVSVPAGRIAVRRGIETFGGFGASLARGVVTRLAATPFCVRAGGAVDALTVDGGLTTHGADVPAVELAGRVAEMALTGPLGPG